MAPRSVLLYSLTTFFTFVAIFVLSARGYVDTVDATASIDTARQWMETGSITLPPATFDPSIHTQTPDNRIYSKMGWTHPLLYLLPVYLGKRTVSIFPSESVAVGFFVSLINPILGALLMSYLAFWSLAAGRSRWETTWLLALLGLGSYFWPYTKSCHREVFLALMITVGYGEALRSPRPHAGWAFGLAVLCKPISLLATLPVILLLPAQKRMNTLYPTLLCLATTMLISWWLFGHASSMGYSKNTWSMNTSVWSTPGHWGLYRQWLDPQSTIFIYCPGLVAILASIFHRGRNDRPIRTELILISAMFMYSVPYAFWWAPLGGTTLGPRYLLAVLPLAFLALANRPWIPQTRPAQWALALLLVLCFALQLIHVSVKPGQYWTLRAQAHSDLVTPHWWANARMFIHKQKSLPEIYLARDFGGTSNEAIDLRPFQSLQGFDYWWAHYARTL